MSAAEFRNLLEAGDVEGCRAYSRAHTPHLPQAETREDAEVVMHHTRTAVDALTLKARAYSHRWLCERGLPSGLPDELKPSAERLYPRVVEAVLISVLNRKGMEQAKPIVEAEIAEVVADAYASGRTDPGYVSGLISDTKARSIRSLFGRSVP